MAESHSLMPVLLDVGIGCGFRRKKWKKIALESVVYIYVYVADLTEYAKIYL